MGQSLAEQAPIQKPQLLQGRQFWTRFRGGKAQRNGKLHFAKDARQHRIPAQEHGRNG